MNCGPWAEQMRALLPRMRACASVPIIAKPNAGLPVVVNGKPSYALSPGEFARQAEALIRRAPAWSAAAAAQARRISSR